MHRSWLARAACALLFPLAACPPGDDGPDDDSAAVDDDTAGDDDSGADDDSAADDDTAADDDSSPPTHEGKLMGLDDASAVLRGGAVNDFAGWSVAAGDLDGDGVADLLVGAINVDAHGTDTGVVYLVPGPITADASLSDAPAWSYGEEGEARAGWSVALAGDVDGDGVADALVGSPGASNRLGGSTLAQAGAAYLLAGPLAPDHALTAGAARTYGGEGDDHAGTAVAAGDVDGDGVPDLVVSAPGARPGGTGSGAVYVFSGPAAGSMGPDSASGTLAGESAEDSAGSALAVGDVDGDGIADVVVGAPGRDSGGSDAGAVYVVLGPIAGTVDLADADAVLLGEAADDRAGISVAVGDVDGDGLADVLAGAPGRNTVAVDAGMAYVLLGPVTGSGTLVDADARLAGVETADQAGFAVAFAGDVDGDGSGDVLVGAPSASPGASNAGIAYLVSGSARGDVSLASSPVCFLGTAPGDQVGQVIGGADVDGDGRTDVILGVPSADDPYAGAGAVYVYSGAELF
ncbi:integrin alpha [Myxococcota bacterium]|nr:integrin alpha [Myxococcota bacterium]